MLLSSYTDTCEPCKEVNGLTVKSASHEVDIQKNSDSVRKMEKQRSLATLVMTAMPEAFSS